MRSLMEIQDKLKKITTDIQETEDEIRDSIMNDEDCSDNVEYLDKLRIKKQLLEWVLG